MAYKILDSLGYYRIKKIVKHRMFCKKLQKEDTRRKLEVRKAIEAMHGAQLRNNNNASDIIVSLTSYGIRVEDTLPYTLYSLLKQTRMPNRIVVWLDNANWSDDKLPEMLQRMKSFGIEFYYVKDIRSYKKLIPALIMFPDNVIITVDDDLYYNNHIVEWLLDAYYKSDKQSVFGSWAFQAKSENGRYMPYSQWKENINRKEDPDYSLIGCGGILYPPHIFDGEILKEQLFMEMAPTADDIWFWVMEKRQSIAVRLIPQACYGLHVEVNRIDRWDPNREGSLYYINEINGKNDEQFIRLINNYSIKPDA